MSENQGYKEELHHKEIEEVTLMPEQEIEQLKTELATMKNKWIWAIAEAENIRKRSQKEKDETLKYASSAFARDMLNVADNLRRALESFPTDIPENFKSMVEGIEMVEKELKAIFERQGIQEIEISIGTKFDPDIHQAMFEVPTSDFEPGCVVQVMQKGYVLHNRLLRPVMVGVAKAEKKQETMTQD